MLNHRLIVICIALILTCAGASCGAGEHRNRRDYHQGTDCEESAGIGYRGEQLRWRNPWSDAGGRAALAGGVVRTDQGIRRLPESRRAMLLESWLQELCRVYKQQILPISFAEASAWAKTCAEAERCGTPVAAVDGLIAATAKAHGLAVATCNVSDFEPKVVVALGCGEFCGGCCWGGGSVAPAKTGIILALTFGGQGRGAFDVHITEGNEVHIRIAAECLGDTAAALANADRSHVHHLIGAQYGRREE